MSQASQADTQRSTTQPEFLLLPYDDRAISQANYETARKIVEEVLPLLRRLRQLNWRVEVMDGF
jgi:hypothetical protein